jgi:hypothetical protein
MRFSSDVADSDIGGQTTMAYSTIFVGWLVFRMEDNMRAVVLVGEY